MDSWPWINPSKVSSLFKDVQEKYQWSSPREIWPYLMPTSPSPCCPVHSFKSAEKGQRQRRGPACTVFLLCQVPFQTLFKYIFHETEWLEGEPTTRKVPVISTSWEPTTMSHWSGEGLKTSGFMVNRQHGQDWGSTAPWSDDWVSFIPHVENLWEQRGVGHSDWPGYPGKVTEEESQGGAFQEGITQIYSWMDLCNHLGWNLHFTSMGLWANPKPFWTPVSLRYKNGANNSTNPSVLLWKFWKGLQLTWNRAGICSKPIANGSCWWYINMVSLARSLWYTLGAVPYVSRHFLTFAYQENHRNDFPISFPVSRLTLYVAIIYSCRTLAFYCDYTTFSESTKT